MAIVHINRINVDLQNMSHCIVPSFVVHTEMSFKCFIGLSCCNIVLVTTYLCHKCHIAEWQHSKYKICQLYHVWDQGVVRCEYYSMFWCDDYRYSVHLDEGYASCGCWLISNSVRVCSTVNGCSCWIFCQKCSLILLDCL